MVFEDIANNTESQNEEKWRTPFVLRTIYYDCKWRSRKLEDGETWKCNPAAAPSYTRKYFDIVDGQT